MKKPVRRFKRVRRVEKNCVFCKQKREPDYKDVESLRRYISERGRIIGRGETGICQKHQQRLTAAIKRGRFLALLPFIVRPS